MQKSYVVKLTVFFSDVDIYVREGDVCVHTPTENKLTIYRGGEILKTCVRTADSIESMVKLGWIKHHQSAAEEAPAPAPAVETQTEEPKPDPEAEEPKTEDEEPESDEPKTETEEESNEGDAKSDELVHTESNDEKVEAPAKKAKKTKK